MLIPLFPVIPFLSFGHLISLFDSFFHNWLFIWCFDFVVFQWHDFLRNLFCVFALVLSMLEMHISLLLMQRLHQVKNSWFPMKSCLLNSQTGTYQFRCSYIFPINQHYGVAGLRTLRKHSFHGSGHMLSFWNYSLQQEPSECKFIGINRNLTVSGKSFVHAFPPNLQSYLQLMRIDRPIG